MSETETERCLVCLEPATVYAGHVMAGAAEVTAGWCRAHADTPCPNLLNRQGCYGAWIDLYGRRREK